jgi:Planctomycete cytochrome C
MTRQPSIRKLWGSIYWLILASLTAIMGTLPCRAQGPSTKTPQFEKDVLPLLTANCLKCHGSTKPKAGLDLRTRAGILKGGGSRAGAGPRVGSEKPGLRDDPQRGNASQGRQT